MVIWDLLARVVLLISTSAKQESSSSAPLVGEENCTGSFRLPRYYSDGMVFQSSPSSTTPSPGPTFWGFSSSADFSRCPIVVEVTCGERKSEEVKAEREEGPARVAEAESHGWFIWSVVLPPGRNGEECSARVRQGDREEVIRFVYGDVWVCSGQSNMEFKMAQVFNASEEIAASKGYGNIRMFKVAHATSDVPQEDVHAGSWDRWRGPAEAESLSDFSAVCFLTARRMTQLLTREEEGEAGKRKRVFGIEVWSSAEAIGRCYKGLGKSPTSFSVLWNAMVHPLTRHSIYGMLWYQGEANAHYHPEKYGCAFPAMVADWRRIWRRRSTAAAGSKIRPFGFVQLANSVAADSPVIRDLGFVPNRLLPRTFMAVALDTYDKEGGIHPRNKQVVAARLSVAAMSVAYGLSGYPSAGPFPEEVRALPGGVVVVEYDRDFAYHPDSDISGFYVCDGDGGGRCDSDSSRWIPLPKRSVRLIPSSRRIEVRLPAKAGSPSLGYLWADTPTEAPLGLPLYGADRFALPAAPFRTGRLPSGVGVKVEIIV